ncbi:MAG: hypothetical protein K6F81_00425 [Acholeplasmatales bacterium]|nr:hypothetical protein [Acholeplasmatales bacterium]
MKKKIAIISSIVLSALTVGTLTPLVFSQTNSTSESVKLTNGKSQGRTIYVDAAGSSEVDGTNASAPTTFAHAHQNALPGDTILLNSGIYKYKDSDRQQLGVRPVGATSSTPVVTGTYDNYITIMPNPQTSGRVVFDFSGMVTADANRGIQIYSDYWYIKDIEVYGAGDNGIYIAGSHNIVENCLLYGNRDTGLQIGRAYSDDSTVDSWPTCNLVKNCTSFANYDYTTFGENADGFAAKLTVGYGNIFDGCIAFRNSDDGWDLFAKVDSGDIGTIIIYNSVSFENGFLPFKHFKEGQDMTKPADQLEQTYDTLNGDGIGFKLGGSTMKGNVIVENSMAFDNKLHGVGDNSNPGVLQVSNFTAFNNCAGINTDGTISSIRGLEGIQNKSNNIDLARSVASYNSYYGILSYVNNQPFGKTDPKENYSTANDSSYNKDAFRGSTAYSIFNTEFNEGEKYVAFTGWEDASSYRTATEDLAFSGGVDFTRGLKDSDFKELAPINTNINIKLDNIQYSSDYEGHMENGEFIKGTLQNESFRDELYNTINSVHENYRNTDHSVNMHDHLALSDSASDLKTYANGKPVGSTLNKSSWNDYDHYDMIDFYNDDYGTLSEAEIAVKSALSICEAITRYDATYQDFRLPKLLHNTDISWKSSNTDVVNIEYSEEYSVSWSAFSWARISVPDQDTEVTLTATATSGKVSESKDIKIIVKGRNQKLGEIISTGVDAIRVNIYGAFVAPRLYPTDNSSITVSELPASLYDLRYTVKYANDGKSKFYTIAKDVEDVASNVYTSVPGVYEITATATLNSNGESQTSYTYRVYVVDPDCDIDFVEDASVTLSQDGFVVSGNLSNIEGDVVATWSTTPLTLNSAADIIARDDAQYCKISTDSIVAQFNADNRTVTSGDTQYYLYYAVVNANRSNASKNPVYSSKVDVVTIDSEEEFYSMAKTGKIDSKSLSVSTIYSLTRDLDFKNKEYTIGADIQTFTGLFRGNNHTISNISIDETDNTSKVKSVNIISKVSNGTIMDVKFDNISIIGDSATAKQVGIIGELQGGYVYNVHGTRINTYGKEAIGGIIGQVTGGINYVANCSLVNPYDDYYGLVEINDDGDAYFAKPATATQADGREYYNSTLDYKIHATNKYAGGIIGNAQMNNDQSVFKLYVHDCYVNAVIGDGNDAGGNTGLLISRIKNDNVVYHTEVYNNFVKGLVIAKGQYNAGIIGDLDNGSGTVVVKGNISEVDFLYNGLFYNALTNMPKGINYAHKNSNSIIGRPVTNPLGSYETGSNYGLWGEYYPKIVNSASMIYDLWNDEANTPYTINENICSTIGFDMTNTWKFVDGIYDADTKTWTVRPSIILKAISE